MQIWLTQSTLTAERLAQQLHGPVQLLPLLKSKPLPVLEPVITANTWLIITSITAISYWRFLIPKKVIVMGPASADYARAHGFENLHVASGSGSEALLAEIKIPKTAEILIASVNTRRGLLESELTAQGYRVQSLDLYENLPLQENVSYLKDHVRAGDIIVVASQQALSLLLPELGAKAITWITMPRIAPLLAGVAGQVHTVAAAHALAELINSCYRKGAG